MLGHAAFGQFSVQEEARMAELHQLIEDAEHDSVVAAAYYDLSDILYVIKVDTILYYCGKSLEICERNLARELSEQERRSFMNIKASCLNNIGYFYKSKSDIPQALKHYNESILMYEELNNSLGKSRLLNNIAVIYEGQGEMSLAVEYYEEALKGFEENDSKKGYASTLNNLGRIYSGVDQNYEKALDCYMKSLAIREEIEDNYGRSSSLNNVGYIYLIMGDTAKGLDYLHQSLELRRMLKSPIVISSSLINIGNVRFAQGNLELALQHGREALEIGQKEGYLVRIQDASLLLKQVYQEQGKVEDELAMYELYIKCRDSLNSEENTTAVYRQQLQYEYQKRKALDQKETETQLAIADEREERQRILTIVSSICLFIFLLLSLILFSRLRLIKKQKGIIETQNTALEGQNAEKEYMMMEIHHRVKNNLQIVKSLLRFQSREIEDPEILQMFEDSERRIISMSLVHEQMYRSENLMAIDLEEHLTSLVTSLIEDYSIYTEIQLESNIEKAEIGVKALIPLGLIVNEIVANSLKHAFVGRSTGVIFIVFKRLNDDQFELLIGDNGIGKSQQVLPGNSGGIGMELVEIFTEQLDGTVRCVENDGTSYEIVFHDQR